MKKVNILVFLGILFVFGLLNIFRTTNADVLESENRTIEKPIFTVKSLFSGDYFRDYDVYFADTFVFRDTFIEISNQVKTLKGVKTADDAEIFTTTAINVGNKINEVPNHIGASDLYPQEIAANDSLETSGDQGGEASSNPKEEDLAITSLGKILIVDNDAMEIHTRNEVAEKGYPDAINYIAERVDANIYSMLIPTSIEFTEKEKYRDISYSQKETINAINARFIDGITPVDAYTYLENNKEQYLYMHTDHHWTAIGAYQAYLAFMETMQFFPIPLERFEMVEYDGYLGSLFRVTQSEKLKNNPDKIFAFLPIVETQYDIQGSTGWYTGETVNLKFFDSSYTTNPYGVYLEGDKGLSIITSDLSNNRSILVIKDSYANSFIPFLTSHFKKIYVVDPRMFTGNIINYIKDENIDNVLFLNYVLVNRYTGYMDLFNTISGNQ